MPYLLRGGVDLLGELAGRVGSGNVSTEGKVSSIAGLPLSIDAVQFEKHISDPSQYLVEARVTRGMLNQVVASLRTLGFDAIGITRASDSNGPGYLAVRGGFSDLSHLKELPMQPSKLTAVSFCPNWNLTSPGAPEAESFAGLTVPSTSRR